MKRRQFLKNAGTVGLCSCFVARALGADPAPSDQPAAAKDRRNSFARQRYSKLLTLVAARVDEKTFREIVEEVGHFCSEEAGYWKNHVGRLEDLLAELQKRWGAKTAHDADRQVVQLSFVPPNGNCACPLLGKGLVPAATCHCSVGSIQRSFSRVTGSEVAVDLKESVLQGGQSCSFVIRLKPA